MHKHTIWLIGIILLALVSFLAVFKPITFAPRKNPADASRYLAPVGVTKNWDSSTPPTRTFSVSGNLPVFVYVPQHDLSLGLDLRGGMRVVLKIVGQGEFQYSLKNRLVTQDEIAAKKQQLTDEVNEKLAAIGGNPSVDLTADTATITTTVETSTPGAEPGKAAEHLKLVTEAMKTVFPEPGAFDAPSADKVYKKADKTMQNEVISIMEKRIDPEGVKELNAYPKGDDQLVIEIPGEKDPDHVTKLLGETSQLRFMLLAQDINVGSDEKGNVTLSRLGQPITHDDALKSAILVLNGSELDPEGCTVGFDQGGKPKINFKVRNTAPPGGGIPPSERFGQFTGANRERYLAIVLDNTIRSAPVIKATITSQGEITGNFTEQEAKDLVTTLKAGALSVKLSIMEMRTISATMGADSVAKSLFAGIIGLIAVLIFMVAYYRLPGLMANFALIVYIFLTLAVIKAFGSTLTLPGIAGIIISIGMAVDANVIIFERLKEELRTQKPLETAIDVAFSRAWTAILDSNVASLITGVVLYNFGGSGAVQNFALTLMIGVAVSLFTAVTITRLFMKLMIRSKTGHNLSWYGV